MVEPFGPPREDLRATLVAATVANGTMPRRDHRAWQPSDFFSEGPRQEPRRWKDWRQAKAAVLAALGGED